MMNARRRRFVLVTAVLAALAAPAAVHAQDTGQESPSAPAKPKKKPKKKPAPPPAADETKPAQEETKPAQDDTKPAGDDTKAASDDGKPAGEGKKAAADDSSKPPEVDITDTREDPNTRYLFAGLRYRGTVIPQFIESLFVDEGGTFYSNLIGVELDVRKNGQSMIPWIAYADYSTGDTLFHQKGSDPMIAGNYTVVRSNLKMIYLGLDELWSVPIDPQTHHWDFEFGFGVGLGIV
ncbi:MAG TPA: hypothetical protein VE987_00120, partial [Polyangiaceae bacterium]|nr:hypothetical protein [Polyangiaceae bacterium]